MRMDTYSGLVSITMGSHVYNIEMWMKTVKFYIIFLRGEEDDEVCGMYDVPTLIIRMNFSLYLRREQTVK